MSAAHRAQLRDAYLEKLDKYLSRPSQSSNPKMQLLRQRLSAARDCLLPGGPDGQDLRALEKLLGDFFEKLDMAEAQKVQIMRITLNEHH